MAKTRRTKAHVLPIHTRLKIGMKKARNPDITFGELATQFSCTYHQARQACIDYNNGKLDGRKRRQKRKSQTGDTTLISQYETALEELASFELDPKERILLLEKLTQIRKTVQQIELQAHIKRSDAHIIARIIRRFDPTASDEQVIVIYKEELEKCKNSL